MRADLRTTDNTVSPVIDTSRLNATAIKYVINDCGLTDSNFAITNSGTEYDGSYSNASFMIKPNFLMFEHTDGLNYINTEIRRNDKLYNREKLTVSFIEGFGGGVLVPRTNTTLLNNPRYDQFHLAGFGLGAMIGLNVEFINHIFIQTELKAGYINMPSIRTTMFTSDIAKQSFNFLQTNIVFGYRFFAKKRNTK